MNLPDNSLFLCYRRDDGIDEVGRIYDRLTMEFGKASVFRDVDSIPYGADFREHIRTALADCRIFLLMIGKSWLSDDETGKPRLETNSDLVRIEIETALSSDNCQLIPVLVNGAKLPKESQLPSSISSLAFKQAASVRREPDFRVDMDRLVKHIRDATGRSYDFRDGHASKLFPIAPDNPDSFNIVSMRDIDKMGWAAQEFLREVRSLDRKVFGSTPIEHWGGIDQWVEKWTAQPDGSRAILTGRGEIVGYWSFVCLYDEEYDKMKAGQLFDGYLKPSKFRSFDLPGVYPIHITTMAIDTKFRGATTIRLLLNSLSEVLVGLARQDIYFGEVCANAYTSKGESLCRSLGMRYLIEHVDDGKMYCMRLLPPPHDNFFSGKSELMELYARKAQSIMKVSEVKPLDGIVAERRGIFERLFRSRKD